MLRIVLGTSHKAREPSDYPVGDSGKKHQLHKDKDGRESIVYRPSALLMVKDSRVFLGCVSVLTQCLWVKRTSLRVLYWFCLPGWSALMWRHWDKPSHDGEFLTRRTNKRKCKDMERSPNSPRT